MAKGATDEMSCCMSELKHLHPDTNVLVEEITFILCSYTTSSNVHLHCL